MRPPGTPRPATMSHNFAVFITQAMGKKLRLSKSHAESLSRALNDQSRHGGAGHPAGAAPLLHVPPLPQQLDDAQGQGRMGSGFQPSHSRASLFW